jgi:hypothetical protein
MSHYFDDVLHRGARGNGTHTPTALLSPAAPRLRRSSTTRSLAARSDYSDANGDHTEDEDGGTQTPGTRTARRGSVNPALLSDPVRVKEREEADAHLHSYISQQLERVQLERADQYENLEGDEFIAKAS